MSFRPYHSPEKSRVGIDSNTAQRSSAGRGMGRTESQRHDSSIGSSHELDYSDVDEHLFEKRRETKFLLKLDVCLMTWAWLAYLIKQIDSSNYKTAYASGMKEDMNFQGNQLNYLDTLFRIGYAVFLIPSQLILTSVRPKFWLPPLELAWGALTGLMAISRSIEGMYALRFFIGVFEASSYPGIVTILCNWYTPSELATRVAIFSSSYPAASMFVSFMQVAIHETLDGTYGIAGWRWLFILNAIMTVVVAAAGFFLIPDAPGMAKVFWMSGEDDKISRWRLDRVKKLPPTKLSWKSVKKTFKGWQLYIFTLSYAFWAWATNSNTWIILFLKDVKNPDGSLRFSVSEINAIPIGGYALQLIAMLVVAWLSSRTGKRATWIVLQMVITLVGCVILSIWPASFGVKMVGYFLLWLNNSGGPILIAWMADWCPSPEERNVIVGVAVTFVYAVDSFANVLIYPASEAPNYNVGYKAAAGFCVASLLSTAAFKYKDRQLRRRQAEVMTMHEFSRNEEVDRTGTENDKSITRE